MSLTIRVLSIEGNPVDAYLIRAAFASIRRRSFEVEQVASLGEGLDRLAQQQHQVVILDLSLPDTCGLAAVQRLREAEPAVPILVFTGQDDEELALKALKAGAQDYLVKGQFDVGMLDSMVLHAIERQRLSLALDRVRRRDIQRRDEFLSNVSHELRTPLAVIEQFTSILGDGLVGSLNERQLECTEVLMRNAKQLRRMVDDLLEVSRVDSGKLALDRSHVELSQVVRETLHGLSTSARRRQITIVSKLDDELAVHADPMRIAQVLANLVDNAIKFTPRGGTVTISTTPSPSHRDQVEIAVADNGCGIDESELPALFERLVQADGQEQRLSRKGLGLGLYISREIVKAHGGLLWARSQPGQGSVFRFTVPAWSLGLILEPLLASRRLATEPLQLLRISAHPRAGHAGPVSRRVQSDVDDLVRRTAADVGGVVLPKSGETALVLGPLSRSRLPELMRRLRQRFAQARSVDGQVLRLTVRHSLLAEPTALAGRPTSQRIAEVTRRLALSEKAASKSRQAAQEEARQRRQAKGRKSTSTL